MRHRINRALSNAHSILADVADLLPPDSPQAQTLAEAMRLVESLDTRERQSDRREEIAPLSELSATPSSMTH